MSRRPRTGLATRLAILALLAPAALAQAPGEVLWAWKISAARGNGPRALAAFDEFGSASAAIGDLDGDGVTDVVVGCPGDDDTGTSSGADYGGLWVLFMQKDGRVKSSREISRTSAALPLDQGDEFGCAVRELGDFDEDGIPDLLVGAARDDDGGTDQGAVYLLFMERDGAVRSWKKISQTAGGFTADLDTDDQFGRGARCIGDLDLDGVPDLAVGAIHDDDGGTNRGCVYVLFMQRDGGVKGWSKLSDTQGNLQSSLSDWGEFGSDCALLGDRDSDGVQDIAIGSPDQSTGGLQQGAVFVVCLNANGTAKSDFRITEDYAGFDGDMLDHDDEFGGSIDTVGDLDGDGNVDIAVGAGKDDGDTTESVDRGAVYVLFLDTLCTVEAYRKIGFPGELDGRDRFGSSLACPGDLNGDGVPDLFAGARFDDDGGSNAGALYFLALNDGSLTPPTDSTDGPRRATGIDGFRSAQAPGTALRYGCGINPPGSLNVLAGSPRLGTTMTFWLTNPLGTQGANTRSTLLLSLAPDLHFPCGTPAENLGMAGPGRPGEWLIRRVAPDPVMILHGTPWSSAGSSARVNLPIPLDPSLLGTSLYVQGFLLDPAQTFGVRVGLTDAMKLIVGP